MQTYKIWRVGFRDMETIGPHKLVGESTGKNFKDACDNLLGARYKNGYLDSWFHLCQSEEEAIARTRGYAWPLRVVCGDAELEQAKKGK